MYCTNSSIYLLEGRELEPPLKSFLNIYLKLNQQCEKPLSPNWVNSSKENIITEKSCYRIWVLNGSHIHPLSIR